MFNKNKLRKILTILLSTVVVFLIMAVILLLFTIADLFILFNFLFAICLLIIVSYTRNSKDFSIFQTTLLVAAVFNPAITVITIILILAKVTNYNSCTIRIVSSLIAGLGNDIRLYICFGIFCIFLPLMIILTTKGASLFCKRNARYFLDNMPAKMIVIETELSEGTITEDEAEKSKNTIKKEANILCALNSCTKLISGNAKLIVFLVIMGIIGGGSAIDKLLRGEIFLDAIKYYMRLSVGCSILFMFPIFFISIAVMIVTGYPVVNNDK